MLFLAVLGGAAVLEVHRALHNGNGDVKELREREATLRRQLQDVQRDLRAAQQQRELTEQEAAQLSAVNQRLSGENYALGAATTSLRAENEALMARADALLERQALLEQCAESLKLENSTLIGQFDRLKLKHEAEAAGFGEQLAELKAAVGGALSRFTAGDLSADQLVAFLSQMGVELRGRKEDLNSLPEQLNSARSTEERLKLLDRVEVDVSDGWLQQMRMTAEPGRAARLLMAGASRTNGAAAAGAPLLEAPESAAAAGVAAASTSAPAPLGYTQPSKLPTPPKGRQAAQLPSVAVPPLKLGNAALAPAASTSAPADAAVDENTVANALAAAALPQADKAGNVKGKKGALRFLPGKKAVKKQAAVPAAPQLGLDVELGQQGHASAMPRLPFASVHDDDMEMPGSRSLMAL